MTPAAAAVYQSEIIGDSSPFHKVTNLALSSAKPRENRFRQISKDVTGHSSSSPRNQHSEEEMADHSVSIPRTKQDCATDLTDTRVIKQQVKLALVSDHKHLRSPMKQIARHAQCSPRTVEAWMEERSLPGLECFLRLVPHSPSLQKMLLRLMTLDSEIDPEYQRAFVDFQHALRKAMG
jgi:hypothetical protein